MLLVILLTVLPTRSQTIWQTDMKMEDADMSKNHLEVLTQEEMTFVHGASAWDDWWYNLGYEIVDAAMNLPTYSPTGEITGTSG